MLLNWDALLLQLSVPPPVEKMLRGVMKHALASCVDELQFGDLLLKKLKVIGLPHINCKKFLKNIVVSHIFHF